MVPDKKKRDKKQTIVENLFLVFVFLVIFGGGVGFLAYQNFKLNDKRSELEQTYQNLRAQAVELEQRKEELEKGLDELETEEFQEKLLREQGLYQKPGEEVVTVIPQDDSGVQVEYTTEDNGKKWWNPLSWF